MYNVVNIFKLPLNADYTDTNKLTTDSFYLFLIHKSVLFLVKTTIVMVGPQVILNNCNVIKSIKFVQTYVHILCYLTKLHIS